MKKLTLIAFVLTLGVSCNKMSEESSMTKDNSLSSVATPFEELLLDFEEVPPQNQSISRKNKPSDLEKGSKIIKEGTMRIEVDDLGLAKTYVDSLLSRNNGYYEKEIFKNSDYSQNYSLKLRVPSSNFNALVAGLESGSGVILEKLINAKDVTEEYLDLEIRLGNNRAYLKRYTELLQKALSIEDIIEIQEKIREIEMLIDSGLGRMKYLDDRADYSTLDIELMAKPKEYIAEAPPSFFEKIIDAFKNGFSGMLYFILILANIWPIILILSSIWIFRARLIGRLKRKSVL